MLMFHSRADLQGQLALEIQNWKYL